MVDSKKVGEVKNDKNGQKFIKELRAFYKEKGFKVRLLGRHHDRKRVERELGRPVGSFIASIPVKYSERIVIYVYGSNPPTFRLKVDSWQKELE